MTLSTPASPTTEPQITVIVAVHNVQAYIAACIKSLLQQEFTDFEALVIDDGSTDQSRAEAETAAAGDPRIRILSYANGGLSAARNRGLDLARGEFIAFVDGDDRVEPGYLARMHAALLADGGNLVSCGLRYVSPSGVAGPPHPGLHGTEPGAQTGSDTVERHDLGNWCEVIRHFPSAWNKLYRRSLIGDLRYVEGNVYEDHAFFWRLAARTDNLLRLPDALYLQTQGRDGQITRDGSDRVFEQFAVLDQLAQIIAESPHRTGGDLAFPRIASRLLFERSLAIHDPGRRARFAARARAYLAEHAIQWSPHWDPGIGRGFGLGLAGHLPLTVIVPSDGAATPLQATLQALAAQGLRDFETLIVVDGCDDDARLTALQHAALLPRASVLAVQALPEADLAPTTASRVARARNRGLDAAQGYFVMFLDAGDLPHPHALGMAVDAMLRYGPQLGSSPDGMLDMGADMGFFPFLPDPNGPAHCGLHDIEGMQAHLIAGAFAITGETAMRLHPLPSAKIFRRAFLQNEGLRFVGHELQSWQFTLEAALTARTVVHVPITMLTLDGLVGHRHFWSAPSGAAGLSTALDAVIAATQTAAGRDGRPLPAGWQHRLFARVIWEKLNFSLHPSPERAAQYAENFARDMHSELARRNLLAEPQSEDQPGVRLDPYIGPRVRKIMQP